MCTCIVYFWSAARFHWKILMKVTKSNWFSRIRVTEPNWNTFCGQSRQSRRPKKGGEGRRSREAFPLTRLAPFMWSQNWVTCMHWLQLPTPIPIPCLLATFPHVVLFLLHSLTTFSSASTAFSSGYWPFEQPLKVNHITSVELRNRTKTLSMHLHA